MSDDPSTRRGPAHEAGAVRVHNARLAPLLDSLDRHDTLDALERLLAAWGTLRQPVLECGLYSAVPASSPDSGATGYRHVWIRDSVHIAHVAWERGDLAAAAAAARGLLAWAELQAPRFRAGIEGRADLADPLQRPHIRFDGERFAEVEGWWPHAQNDALGYALWHLARSALAGLLPCDERLAAVLVRFPAWLRAVRYWEDRDSGHWEEVRKLACSSVGAVVAGLVALRGLLRARPELEAFALRAGTGSLDVAELVEAGRAQLAATLPWETRDPRDGSHDRRADAALLFLIQPLRVVDGATADAILACVRGELTGPWGIRRYVGDSYWMADYKRLFDEQTRTSGFEDDTPSRDRHLKPGTEAQWSLFDPLLVTIHAWRHAAGGDPRERELALWHARRALGQLTGAGHAAGEGLCPEAYYLQDSSRPAEWVANDNTPLLWTAARLASALASLRQLASSPPVA